MLDIFINNHGKGTTGESMSQLDFLNTEISLENITRMIYASLIVLIQAFAPC